MNAIKPIDVISIVDSLLELHGLSPEDYTKLVGLSNNRSNIRLLNHDQAAEYLNMSSQTLKKYVASGDLRQIYMSKNMRRYDLCDLDNFIDKKKAGT